MIIAIAAQKGGTGKSAIAQHLAVYLMKKGHKVKIVDGDRQSTTAEWMQERRESKLYPDIRFAIYTGLCGDDLITDQENGYTVVVDTGGHDSTMMRSSLVAATHLLVPCRPKRRDIKTLSTMNEIIYHAKASNPKLIVKAVISQCPTLPSLGKRIQSAKEACSVFGIEPLNSVISTRESFDDADEGGASVFEYEPKDEKAIAEMTSVFEELLGDEAIHG